VNGKAAANWQLYACSHPNCGILHISADKPYPMPPYCPTRHESESEEQHQTVHQGSTDAHKTWFDTLTGAYVRYTHKDIYGGTCCEFICLGYDEVRCPNCGEPVPDAYRQQCDPKRYVGKAVA